MKKFFFIAVSILVCATLAGAQEAPAPAAGPQAAELSARLQEDVSHLLEQLVGRDRARAFVTAEGEITLKGRTDSSVPAEDSLSMPGYSAVNLLEKTGDYLRQQRQESQHTSEFRIKRLSVSLVFDRAVPEKRANAIKLMIAGILRLSEARGDSIITARVEMLPWWKNALEAPEIRPVLLASVFGTLALTALLILGYLLAARLMNRMTAFARPGQGKLAAGAAALDGPGYGPEDMDDIIDVEARAAGGGLIENSSTFEFLGAPAVDETAKLLAGVSDEDVAIVISDLADGRPHLSSKLLAALPQEKRQAVGACMLKLKQIDPERLYDIESSLRSGLAGKLKGPEKLGRLLSLMNAPARTELLNTLSRTDPKGCEELRGKVVAFDELCRLADKNLLPLVLAVPCSDWAAALNGAGEAAIGNIGRLLSGTDRQALKTLMRTRPEEEKIVEARAKIISTALALSGKGRISLKGGA